MKTDALIGWLTGCAWLLLATGGAVAAETLSARIDQTQGRLNPGDRVRVTVLGFPELSGEQTILTDGSIQLPMVGSLDLQGQTLKEATEHLGESLRPFLRRPQVGIALMGRRPPHISVTGEVLRPGPRLATPKTEGVSTAASTVEAQTLSSVLLLAGGVTPNADLRNVVVRRPDLTVAPDEAGALKKREFQVDLWKAMQTGDLTADPFIFDGDEILVPAVHLGIAEQQTLMLSTVAPEKLTIQIAGLVSKPGTTVIPPGTGITGAIAAAGGLTDKGDSNVALLRMSADGRVERQSYRFGEASEPLRNGDVLVVSKSSLSFGLDLATSLLGPLTPLFFLFGR